MVAEQSLATYDPRADAWTELPPIPSTSEFATAAAWSGGQFVVERGAKSALTEYWSYSPSEGWRELPDIWPREGWLPMVSLGEEVMTWGPGYPEYPENERPLGVRYRPSVSTWESLASAGQPSRRYDHALAWTGTEAIVWGGAYYDQAQDQTEQMRDGARYYPDSDTWEPMSVEGAPLLLVGPQATVVAGRRMVVYGVLAEDRHGGAVYDAEADAWSDLTMKCGPPPDLDYSSLTWVDTGLVLWGGVSWCTSDGGGSQICPDNRERAWFLSSEAALGETAPDPSDCRCPRPM
jgi:hypothetical protein